ncbi:spore cortex biosynthesis protein YabQ [Paenibacillus sp. YYML68]|uniref:spore cortex biosynthesis protein YabQ n=1 Tax=Paenibacillus sp. YYML68 TaxID=2909250 RepID=UPI0024900CFA|nr:spore cortex biosynthesis protein YabQ [Paenibacillus sp. YYML68]
MTLHVQFLTLGMMCAGGLSLGGLFDLYRVLSGQLRVPVWLRAVLDLVYWLAGTVIVFLLLYESNWGEVRPFIFLGLGIGVTLYFLLFSRSVIWVINGMIRIVLWIARLLRQLVIIFIIRPAIGLYRLALILFGFVCAAAIFMYRVVLQLLYPLWRLVTWLLRPLGRWLRIPVPGWLRQGYERVVRLIRKLFQ